MHNFGTEQGRPNPQPKKLDMVGAWKCKEVFTVRAWKWWECTTWLIRNIPRRVGLPLSGAPKDREDDGHVERPQGRRGGVRHSGKMQYYFGTLITFKLKD